MKTDHCFLLLLGSAISLGACTKEQDSPARSPESPSTAPQDDSNTAAPNSDVDHGVEHGDDQRMGPQAPGGGDPVPGPSGPSNPPGSGGPTSSGSP